MRRARGDSTATAGRFDGGGGFRLDSGRRPSAAEPICGGCGDARGHTALSLACRNGHTEVAGVLLSLGANVDERSGILHLGS
jgi:hypothetical protein